jgi:monovalent cation/hydrogen antiporter
VLGWSGMRGAVSLAAALAIPATVPDRDLIVVLTYGAVVLTLVVPSLTLSRLIRALGLGQNDERLREEAEARVRLAHVALERLEERAQEEPRSERAVESLRARYEGRLDRAEARLDHRDGVPSEDSRHAQQLAEDAIEAQRDALREMRRERAHPADVLRTLERELDLEDSRLQSRR